MTLLPRDWLDSIARFATRIDLYNFGRWLILASLIGVVAGLGGALLTGGVDGVQSLVLHRMADFRPPGHGTHIGSWHLPGRPWMLLLVLPLAGLLVGWIVQTFAPEAEGHGTDAVINSYHRKGALLRRRVAPVKLLASAITIGSGGSAGREGPVAQVGAGFASLGRPGLARSLRWAVAVGAVITVASFPVVARFGARSDNPTVLPLPAGRNLVYIWVGLLAVAVVVGLLWDRRLRRTDGMDAEPATDEVSGEAEGAST